MAASLAKCPQNLLRAAEAEKHFDPPRPQLRGEAGGGEPSVSTSRHPDQQTNLPVLSSEHQLRLIREVGGVRSSSGGAETFTNITPPSPVLSRAVEGASADVPEGVVGDFLQQETGHLSPPHLRYFSHWLLLCCLEAVTMETRNSQKKIWLQSAEER